MNYIAAIHKEENSEYGVSFPDFPGCVTAGETIDEARKMAEEALQFHVDGMIEDGDPLPSPSSLDEVRTDDAVAYFVVKLNEAPKKKESVRFNCSMDKDLLEKADEFAHNIGMTRSGFIAKVVRKELHL